MTLAEAVSRVQRHVDDDGTRWNAETAVKPVLGEALLRCQDIMLAGGRQEMAEEIEVTTDSNGLYSFGNLRPRKVHNLSVLQSGRYYKLPATQRGERDVIDGVQRTLSIFFTRELVLPQVSTAPLVGEAMMAIPAMAAFAPWVCTVAALHLSVDDNEKLKALSDLEDRLRNEVLSSPGRHNSIVPPPPPTYLSRVLRWIWDPRTQRIQIVRAWRV